MNRGFAFSVGTRAFAVLSSVISGLVSLRLFGHYLETAEYGAVLVALQITSYLPLIDGGFRTTLNRTLLGEADPARRTSLILFGQVLCTWLSLLITPLSLLALSAYGFTGTVQDVGLSPGLFLVLGLTGAAMFINTMQANLLVGLGNQAQLSLLTSLSSWLNLTVLWLGLKQGWGVWTFPLSQLLAVALLFPVTVWLLKTRVPSLAIFRLRRPPDFSGIFHAIKPQALACFKAQIYTLLLFTVDVIMVGILCGAKAAAAYGILSRLLGILRSLCQSIGEAAWPLVASSEANREVYQRFLLQSAPWLYGSITGAVLVTLNPFIAWYMGGDWTTNSLLFNLVLGRFLITGLASNVTYIIYGAGDFQVLSRYLGRELLLAGTLGLVMGFSQQPECVAGAFLLATIVGTGGPLFYHYARENGRSPMQLIGSIWGRALIAFTVSWLGTYGLLQSGASGIWLPVMAGAGVALGLVTGLAVARLRQRSRQTDSGIQSLLSNM